MDGPWQIAAARCVVSGDVCIRAEVQIQNPVDQMLRPAGAAVD
jgi:hypothetical protein